MMKRSKYMKFFERDDGSFSNDPAAPDPEGDFYSAPVTEDEPLPQDVQEDLGLADKSEPEGELDANQDPTSHVTNSNTDGTANADDPTPAAVDTPPADSTSEDAKINQVLDKLADRLAPPVQPTPQQSPEEKAKLEQELRAWLKPIKITKEDLKGLGYEEATDAQLAVMQKMQENTAAHAVRVAQLALEQTIQPIRQQVEYMGHEVSTQNEARAIDSFYQQNEDLKGKENVVTVIANQVGNDTAWLQGKSFNEISERVAKETREFLTGLGVDTTQPTNTDKASTSANLGADPTNSAVPRMQNLRGSGRSSGGQGTAKAAQSGDADIYNT